MKIAIVGAGFTGLAAAYYLVNKKCKVTVFEKGKKAGGLAGSFIMPGWQYPLERHYHHWFANDTYVFDLIEKLKLTECLVFPESRTGLFIKNRIYNFDSAIDVLTFSPLDIPGRIRLGLVLAFLKLAPSSFGTYFDKYTANEWLTKYFGKKVFSLIWKPLLDGKFGSFEKDVNMTWFWARIKKRTKILAYMIGGYQKLIDSLIYEIEKSDGKVHLGTVFPKNMIHEFDKVIFTVPTPLFLEYFPDISLTYKKKLSIPHLHAFNLVLITKERFLNNNTYWLNINDNKFPFIGIIQHTNFINPKYYSGNHITWVASYLPDNHDYLKLSKEELFRKYLPYLKKINNEFNFQTSVIDFQLFHDPYAQPVFPTGYSKMKPDMKTPMENIYLSNMDMVYPWDRGTNYAIELGYNVAKRVLL